MKVQQFFINGVILCFILALFSIKLAAQDKITFTWQATNTNSKRIYFNATQDKIFTVNWGDGTIETKTGSVQVLNFISHSYEVTGEYVVTITASNAECRFLRFECVACNVRQLEFYNCNALEVLYCYVNQITDLDLTGCSALTLLKGYSSNLTNLNLTGCSALTEIWIQQNKLKSIDLSGLHKLQVLDCGSNQLTHLDLAGCYALRYLWCNNNKLENLDFRDCFDLIEISCKNNLLSQLISTDHNINLKFFCCDNNQLTNLNVSGCLLLEFLSCSFNQLNHINISGCLSLRIFDCYSNQLTNLDLSGYSFFEELRCSENRLQLTDLFAAHLLVIYDLEKKKLGPQNLLPKYSYVGQELFVEQSVFNGLYTKYNVTKNGNPAPTSDYNVVKGKLTFNATGHYTVTMSNDVIVSSSESPAVVIVDVDVRNVSISETDLTNFQIFPNPTSAQLTIYNEQLTINSVEIFDIYGRKSLSTQYSLLNTNINISHLQAGIYIVKIFTDKGIFTKEIIKTDVQ